jgi:hypothetical protein
MRFWLDATAKMDDDRARGFASQGVAANAAMRWRRVPTMLQFQP